MKRINITTEINKTMFEMPFSLFPYANYCRYGLGDKIFSLFLTSSNNLVAKYDDSLQICSNTITKADCDELEEFAKKHKIRMISGSTESISLLYSKLNKGKLVDGVLLQVRCKTVTEHNNIFIATTEDEFAQIAKLVVECNKDNASFYKIHQYYHQIYSRYLLGYCHNYFYSDGDSIVGHIATYTEADEYVVLGGLAVDEDHRRQGIAKMLFEKIVTDFKDKKRVYLFCYNKLMLPFYEKYSVNEYPCSKILL